jgi:DeoR/GlpR family transcriptional regulator of sugar metabolism
LRAPAAAADYERREQLSTDVKARLGRAGAALIRAGQLVAVDGGTSNLQLVRALPRDLRCTIVTHSPLIAAELRSHPLIEILLIGGRLFRHSQVAVGAETAEAIGRIRTDLFFLGATGLHPDTGATTGDWEEAAVKRAFCRSAAETVLLVSPEKWGAASEFQIVAARDLSTLVVEGPSDQELAPYQALGLTILRA